MRETARPPQDFAPYRVKNTALTPQVLIEVLLQISQVPASSAREISLALFDANDQQRGRGIVIRILAVLVAFGFLRIHAAEPRQCAADPFIRYSLMGGIDPLWLQVADQSNATLWDVIASELSKRNTTT